MDSQVPPLRKQQQAEQATAERPKKAISKNEHQIYHQSPGPGLTKASNQIALCEDIVKGEKRMAQSFYTPSGGQANLSNYRIREGQQFDTQLEKRQRNATREQLEQHIAAQNQGRTNSKGIEYEIDDLEKMDGANGGNQRQNSRNLANEGCGNNM